MGNKTTLVRLDPKTEQRLQDIHLAKCYAAGAQVAYMTYSPKHNGMTRSDVIRDLIDREWERLNDSGALTRAKISKCPNCGRTDCGRGYFCEG
jgi:hypothetical protein